jgi:hypothetical protein
MAEPKSITPFTMLIGLIFTGSLLWLVLGMLARIISQLGRSLQWN